MDETVIKLDNVTVRFRIPHEKIPTFREYAIRWIKRRGVTFSHFNALDDVSFSIKKGQTVGIIGSNGAGKSTLLKVISRVIRPTEGRVFLKGRIAPLLELGAGFDYEMTGRENIFLNGAVLGFSKKNMADQIEQIVDFSGIKEFIDAPVRTYSSGMVARLGFAIATHIQPEVLIIDEILSVGDAEFQQKSTARILNYHKNGSTILIVSHNAPSIKQLCDHAIWLEHGSIKMQGDANEVVDHYSAYLHS
ncbi:MAG TPA: ABC transporter ATP-binding protein [Candidatus Competibacteraceae bacterium]|nr:MAG: ABC transporter ATP-binding protein [Candidatus Competibacteraceae bacterium]HOB62539.1 ABC transporter ATP-binding protein [Candidatus Competibacteraceae bacterium]HQD57372.1 ABC transporter ATP-binding protein [Candidatus Competibacteraceae bacterium]